MNLCARGVSSVPWTRMILVRCGLASLLCCVLASFAAGASAQAPGVDAVAAPAGTAAHASPESVPTTAAEGAQPDVGVAGMDADMDASVEVAAPVAGSSSNRAELERRLKVLELERAHWTNFWPWFAVATGAGVTLTGTIVGVASTFSCEPETTCAAPPWATLVVVVGAAIGTAGAIWLLRTDAGIRELEIQTQRVRMDLEQLDHAQLRSRGFAKQSAFNVRLSF
jgi:hypothetical protein